MFFGHMLRWGAALALVVLLATPFGRDLYHRYELNRELAQYADPAARAAATGQSGGVAAVGDDLLRRCEQIYGRGDPDCMRYRLSLRD